jgi:hypothetical protein
MTATQEFVVPKSMPITLLMTVYPLLAAIFADLTGSPGKDPFCFGSQLSY